MSLKQLLINRIKKVLNTTLWGKKKPLEKLIALSFSHKGGRKVGEVYILKKINVKNNYRKIGKKKDNDVDVDMAQLEYINNKCYTSALLRTNFPHNMASFHWRLAPRQNYHGFWEKSILKPKRVYVHKNDVEAHGPKLMAI